MAVEPEVFVLVFAAAELSPEVVVLAVEPEVVFVSDPQVFVDIAVAFVVYVSEPQASVDIPVAFVALVPLCVVVVGVDSPGRPRFLVFPNVDCSASPSSSAEVVG